MTDDARHENGTERNAVWFCTKCEKTEPIDEGRMKTCTDCGVYMVLRPRAERGERV